MLWACLEVLISEVLISELLASEVLVSEVLVSFAVEAVVFLLTCSLYLRSCRFTHVTRFARCSSCLPSSLWSSCSQPCIWIKCGAGLAVMGCQRTRSFALASARKSGVRTRVRYAIYLLYWYKRTDTDTSGATRQVMLTTVCRRKQRQPSASQPMSRPKQIACTRCLNSLTTGTGFRNIA